MNTVKFATFTDVHVSDINPGARIGNYKEDILDKLKVIRRVGASLGVDFYLCAGDIFHIKSPMRNTHGTVGELIDLFKSFGAPVYTIEGNHDIQYDRVETLDNQPLGVIYKSGALKQLRKESLNINGIKISLRGFPFEEEPDLSKIEPFDQKSDVGICLLHLYSSPTGGMLFKNKIFSYEELSKLNDDIFVLGHYHLDHGVYKVTKKAREHYFINVGAVCRGALDEDSITRNPKFTITTVSKDDAGKVTISIKQYKIPVRPAAEVFDLQKKEETDERLKVAEEFAESLQNQAVTDDVNMTTLNTEIDGLNIEPNIVDKFKYYMEEANIALNKVTT